VSAGPASQAGMRRLNLGLVLRTIADHGPVSRAAVAARTGLTRAAVSSLVDELGGLGVLSELGPEPSSGRVGRPGSALVVSGEGPAGVGLEIGVEHVAACVVDLRGEVRVTVREEAENRDREVREVLPGLVSVAERALAAAGGLGLRPVGGVVAVPGSVAEGVVVRAPNLGWQGVALAPLLREPLGGVPLGVENEANLGALAELWAGGGPQDFVHVSAEAGIGAALVVGGRLFRGARGFAGELGHVTVYPDGPVCACGARGCLEQYAGERAVLRASGSWDGDGGDRIGGLVRLAEVGDEAALTALDRAGTAMGTALAGAVNLIDPAAVVLGGAYAELAAWLLPGMRRELAARVQVRPWDPEAVVVSALGRRGPLLGAALSTVRRILEDPAELAAAS
jgi:predicted NBD/HSP70 family sugar kinase